MGVQFEQETDAQGKKRQACMRAPSHNHRVTPPRVRMPVGSDWFVGRSDAGVSAQEQDGGVFVLSKGLLVLGALEPPAS